MILTKDRAGALHADKIFFKYNSKAPTEDLYGPVKIGHDFKAKAAIRIEERVGIYKYPYVPCVGGERFGGLFSIGMLSYSWSAIPEQVAVGRYCSIAAGLIFLDSHHPINTVTSSVLAFRPGNAICADLNTDESVAASGWHVRDNKAWPEIGHDVWIGRNVTIAMGVKIGTGAVIAAGSMVTKDVEPYTIVGGNPARPIRERFPSEISTELLALEWWNYHPRELVEIGMHDPLLFASALRQRISEGTIQPYRPTTYILDKDDTFKRMQGG